MHELVTLPKMATLIAINVNVNISAMIILEAGQVGQRPARAAVVPDWKIQTGSHVTRLTSNKLGEEHAPRSPRPTM